jgi:hypothetical protein
MPEISVFKMSRKKATGPVTEAGKQIVSKNALKHSATSKRLLNSEDHALCTKLVEDLNAQYASSNPLELDKLDSLMRYQITLQRQLSTAMGELIAIT